MVKSSFNKAEWIILVNNPNDQNYTIKDSEVISRMKGMLIHNVNMKAEDKFPAVNDFHVLPG